MISSREVPGAALVEPVCGTTEPHQLFVARKWKRLLSKLSAGSVISAGLTGWWLFAGRAQSVDL